MRPRRRVPDPPSPSSSGSDHSSGSGDSKYDEDFSSDEDTRQKIKHSQRKEAYRGNTGVAFQKLANIHGHDFVLKILAGKEDPAPHARYLPRRFYSTLVGLFSAKEKFTSNIKSLKETIEEVKNKRLFHRDMEILNKQSAEILADNKTYRSHLNKANHLNSEEMSDKENEVLDTFLILLAAQHKEAENLWTTLNATIKQHMMFQADYTVLQSDQQ